MLTFPFYKKQLNFFQMRMLSRQMFSFEEGNEVNSGNVILDTITRILTPQERRFHAINKKGSAK